MGDVRPQLQRPYMAESIASPAVSFTTNPSHKVPAPVSLESSLQILSFLPQDPPRNLLPPYGAE